MLTKILLLLAPLLFSVGSSDDLAPGELVEGDRAYALDDFLVRLEGLGFSGIVGVEDGGGPILLRGYGLADRERGVPVTPETVFCTGSITKQFTAAAILALQEEGKLSVQDALGAHFDGVPEDKRGITLHHLLTHTSGLVDPPAGDHDLRATAAWVRDFALGCTLEFAPGTEYAYQNVNYSLLGMIVAQRSGKPYETYLQERLFAPVGMQRTGYQAPAFAPESLALGYEDGDLWGTTLGRPMLPDGPCWTLRANGGIHSTVADMLRWHAALQADRVLSRESRELLEAPHADEGGGTAYGYGWSIQRSPAGTKLVAHNGGNGIFFADCLRFVEDDRCIFVATNVGSRFRGSLAYDLAAILYDRPARALPETLARDREWLERYAGTFPLGEGSALVVENGGDRLVLTGHGDEAIELLSGAHVPPLVAGSRELAAAACSGDDGAFLDAYAGRQDAASVRAELAEARARWTRDLGAFVDAGAASVRAGADDGTRIAVEARFERGRGHVALTFGPAGRLVGFECLDAPPFDGAPRIELFPLSATEFRAYDERAGGLGATVTFELDGERAAALALPERDVSIPRE
jgi:CubicO group peptidase (beta-lactamase class C family)